MCTCELLTRVTGPITSPAVQPQKTTNSIDSRLAAAFPLLLLIMSSAKLLTAVVHASQVKAEAAPLAALRAAAQACGTEKVWLGGSDEEKASINAWMETDKSD